MSAACAAAFLRAEINARKPLESMKVVLLKSTVMCRRQELTRGPSDSTLLQVPAVRHGPIGNGLARFSVPTR